jgi:hypothetical protein
MAEPTTLFRKFSTAAINRFAQPKSHIHLLFAIVGLIMVGLGAYLIYQGTAGNVNFTFAGLTLSGASPGVVVCVLGFLVIYKIEPKEPRSIIPPTDKQPTEPPASPDKSDK